MIYRIDPKTWMVEYMFPTVGYRLRGVGIGTPDARFLWESDTNMGAFFKRDIQSQLPWTAEWHLRDETYQAALACLVDEIHAQPFTALWGDGETSSSDGQFFRAGGHGEARADHNAHYGSEPGIKFYTHVSDRFAPFYTKVIAGNASEAAHVLDGLLHHESSLIIREHYTDTGGATEHVFVLCHLLGFRFAPRLRDLADRRLYVVDRRADHGALDCLIGGAINFRKIEENWDETLRMTASIRAGTVAPSVLMRRLPAYPRQNALARALREIGCLERTLFILDWIFGVLPK
jgi:TnpA family transposase